MTTAKRVNHSGRPDNSATTGLERAAGRFSRFHRVSWREALAGFASPALRLHRYRNAHNQLLRDALCELDCPGKRGPGL